MVAGLLLLALAGLVACMALRPKAPDVYTSANTAPVDHSIYDRLLKKYVNDQGWVDYKGLKKDEKDAKELKKYLDLISKNPPSDKWSKNDQIAYWINAYNAFTIQRVLNHYPITSIKDTGPSVQIPFVSTPWSDKFFKIGGESMSLDNIEHGTLRKKYNEPRIHFALVCAARSCPRLRNEAYEGDKLIAQLEDQGNDFLNNPDKNAITTKEARLSKYFDWYKSDWKENDKSVEYWVDRYSKVKINKDTKISFLDYNWALNEQK